MTALYYRIHAPLLDGTPLDCRGVAEVEHAPTRARESEGERGDRTMSTGTHECPVDGCHITLPSAKLMCWRHWRTVPVPLQREVWRLWEAAPLSDAYMEARQAAIDAVNGLRGVQGAGRR